MWIKVLREIYIYNAWQHTAYPDMATASVLQLKTLTDTWRQLASLDLSCQQTTELATFKAQYFSENTISLNGNKEIVCCVSTIIANL